MNDQPVPARRMPPGSKRMLWVGGAALLVALAVTAIFKGPIAQDGKRDGDLSFAAGATKCGVAQIGFNAAHGQFCTVQMTVRNVGRGTVLYNVAQEVAVGSDGTRYPVDPLVSTVGGQGGATLDQGGRTQATLAFDVPKNVTLKSVVMHGPDKSAGIEITLSS